MIRKLEKIWTLQAQLGNLSAPRPRNSIVALRARFYILRIHLTLFLVIWSWSSSQFYNIVGVNCIFSKLINLFLISNEKRNSMHRLYQPYGTHSYHDTRASSSIFCIHFYNFLIHCKKKCLNIRYLCSYF